MPDFRATDHGTLIALKPLSPEGELWVVEHLPEDAPRWCGAVAIGPRYFEPIYEGILGDGLTLSRTSQFSSKQHEAYQAFVQAINVALEARDETFGVVQIADIPPAFYAGVSPADFAAAQVVRSKLAIQRFRDDQVDRQQLAFAARLDADAALGFTRD